AVVVLLSWRSASAAWLACAVLLAFLLLGQYVLPWYVAWELPALALVWRSRLAMLAAAQAALLGLAYVPVRGTGGVWRSYYAAISRPVLLSDSSRSSSCLDGSLGCLGLRRGWVWIEEQRRARPPV